ncbi:hypothetical protein V3C99_003198 [Haemonchus contortus]
MPTDFFFRENHEKRTVGLQLAVPFGRFKGRPGVARPWSRRKRYRTLQRARLCHVAADSSHYRRLQSFIAVVNAVAACLRHLQYYSTSTTPTQPPKGS